MDVAFSAGPVSNLAAVAEALGDASSAVAPAPGAVLGGENLTVVSPPPDLDEILALLRDETNEARLGAARSSLSSALGRLAGLSESQMAKVDEMKASGKALAAAEKACDAAAAAYSNSLAKLEKAKSRLDSAQDGPSEAELLSARAEYDSAKAETEAAGEKLGRAKTALGEEQDRFDSLVDSLDAASLTALREALRLSAGDVSHLREEIEEDDKKRDAAPVRSVEDVIAAALDRRDGKMSDELENGTADYKFRA